MPKITNHEIHRKMIKREMEHAGNYWLTAFMVYVISLISFLIGINLLTIHEHSSRGMGVFMLVLSVFMYSCYRGFFKLFTKAGFSREWLDRKEQMILMVILIAITWQVHNFSIVAVNGVAMLVGYGFGYWRITMNSKPFYQKYYYRAGRRYFRELRSYRAV